MNNFPCNAFFFLHITTKQTTEADPDIREIKAQVPGRL